MEKNLKYRIFFAFSLILGCSSLILLKAFFIQVLDSDQLISQFQKQLWKTSKVYPKRGSIFDRNGSPLAINIQSHNVFTDNPQELKNNRSELKKISEIIPSLKVNKIKKSLGKRRKFTWIAKKIELNEAQRNGLKELKNVFVEPTIKRVYPNNDLMSHVLGFVGSENQGLYGVEYSLDKNLKGREYKIRYTKDRKGRTVKHETLEIGQDSDDIYLSIDKTIQVKAESLIKEAVKLNDAKAGGIGVMDAKTGEIIALANYPNFDPNHYNAYPQSLWGIPFVSTPFEPGSVMKTFTVASAFENNIVDKDTNYFCEKGQLNLGSHIIREADHGNSYEWLSVSEILKFSSNIGTTKIAFDLKFPALRDTLKSFNFGEKLGIELPGESRGIFEHKGNVTPLVLSNLSFGQGIATTPLQMLTAYSAIANDGILTMPTIIRGKKTKSKRVLSSENTKKIQEILGQAVEVGTGKRARIDYYKIAGKTSTAQKASKKNGYDNYISGFLGFPLEVERPFVVYVYIDEPSGKRYYGGEVAAPVFKKLSEFILFKRQIKPHQMARKEKDVLKDIVYTQASSFRTVKGEVPSFIGLDKLSARSIAKKMGMRVQFIGAGIVKKQFPGSGEKILDSTIVSLYFSPPEM